MGVTDGIIKEKNRAITERDNEIKKLKKELDQERNQKYEIQSCYEKKCAENSELQKKFDNLAIKIRGAIDKSNKEEHDMINVDVLKPLIELYERKADELKEAKAFISNLYNNAKLADFEHDDAKACQLGKLGLDEQRRTVFAGGLPDKTTFDELLEFVSKFGTVEQIYTPTTGPITKAFVMFDSVDCVTSLPKGKVHTIRNNKFHIQRFHQSYVGDPAVYTPVCTGKFLVHLNFIYSSL